MNNSIFLASFSETAPVSTRGNSSPTLYMPPEGGNWSENKQINDIRGREGGREGGRERGPEGTINNKKVETRDAYQKTRRHNP